MNRRKTVFGKIPEIPEEIIFFFFSWNFIKFRVFVDFKSEFHGFSIRIKVFRIPDEKSNLPGNYGINFFNFFSVNSFKIRVFEDFDYEFHSLSFIRFMVFPITAENPNFTGNSGNLKFSILMLFMVVSGIRKITDSEFLGFRSFGDSGWPEFTKYPVNSTRNYFFFFFLNNKSHRF